jgi:hypothetical protein
MKRTKVFIRSESFKRIKDNDSLLIALTELENAMRKLYDPFSYNTKYDHLIYKDKEGNKIIPECFYEDIQHFIDRNVTYLQNDSKENYKNLIK